LALMAIAMAAPLLIAASGPANAICFRKCTGLNPGSGACTSHETVCEELLQSVADKLKPLRDGMRCRTQGLLCDYTGCKAVCGAPPKKKK
jgi:hypothetical protein